MSENLAAVAAEIEAHVAANGWDQPPVLYALVRVGRFRADEPETAARLGLDDADEDLLTPIEQEPLPEGALDEVLAQIAWPESVAGCALTQEIVVLPPSAEESLADSDDVDAAAFHPDRREARLVVAVLRGEESAAVLRLRGTDEENLLTGADLAPNLVRALHATLESDD